MPDVELSKTYSVGGKSFSKITLREPTYQDVYMDGLGQPREWQPVPGGSALLTYPEKIDAYAQKLIVEPGYEYIAGLSALDARRLEEGICDFFTEQKASPKSQTPSSSSSDGPQSTSSE